MLNYLSQIDKDIIPAIAEGKLEFADKPLLQVGYVTTFTIQLWYVRILVKYTFWQEKAKEDREKEVINNTNFIKTSDDRATFPGGDKAANWNKQPLRLATFLEGSRAAMGLPRILRCKFLKMMPLTITLL